MPELRYNVITRDWVIIATERAKRPDQFKRAEQRKALPVHDPKCPFCPGNEKMTPPATYTVPANGSWRVRVTPNKFAAVSYAGERKRMVQGIKRTITGVGVHEVIVETPEHNRPTALLADSNLETLIETYLDRFKAASSDPRVEQVTIFKNHGEAAGTSLEHPHSQLIGTPVITTQLRDRLFSALDHFDEYGECIFCRVLDQELKEQIRLIMETEHFVAFIPFAVLTPFSLLIMPRRHMACFNEMNDAEAGDLARIMKRVLLKLHRGLADPDYNYVIRTAPTENMGVKYYHWYVSIIPRLTKLAGFEMGSGMFVNVSLPEENASFLREVGTD
jgi:UDPglucose--hexose-1-phosphate uridylyltransferase